jgi:PAS domain S-box-containing protein
VTVNDGNRVVVSVVRDLSDVHELRQQLEQTQASFRTAFEQAPVGIAVTRAAGRGREFVRTNTAFTTMFGYPPGALDGCDAAVLRASEDTQESWLPQPHVVTGPLLDTTVIRRYRRPDGSHLWAEARATTLEGMGDGTPHFLVHAVDVTQRVEAEQSAYLHALVTQIVATATTAAIERRSEESVLELISAGAAEVLDADAVAVLRDDPTTPEGYRWSATFGPLGDALTTSVDAAGGTALLERVARDGATPLDMLPGCAHPDSCPVGPVLLAPLGTAGRDLHGGLVAARAPGRPAFTSDDAERLARLATQTQAAAHFARGRADQERVALLEERQRIARELHDTVIQDVIAVGMVLSAQAGRETDTALAASTLDSVSRLERAVTNLRAAVFELRTDSGRGSLGAGLTAVIEEASRVLGFFPTLTFSGPVDALTDGLADDLVGALREALANVARHSRATSCAVSVTVSPEAVELVVDDNGVGLGSGSGAGYGLGYLEDRAQRHHGHLTVGAGPVDGTRLVWTCPRGPGGSAP